MIPAALAAQLQQGLADFLRMSFWSSTPGMESVIEDLIDDPGALAKGPYLSVKLPFAAGNNPAYFPDVPLRFVPHAHQEQAFERLGGRRKLGTLVATGTGSGKTECFVQPILEHCRAEADLPGVKAILVYPLNALATDQAERLAQTIWTNDKLRGRVTAGLYIGESRKKGKKSSGRAEMGPRHLITDRAMMQATPPHILLTNYKMLDYLLLRARDRGVWQHNIKGTLRYLVVDELHTFDGAQGTDLACLIRRLKRRLYADDGSLCCVGTSATLGGSAAATELRRYAAEVFGEPFGDGSVVGETRISAGEFLAGAQDRFDERPEPGDIDALDPAAAVDADAWLRAQVRLWFGEHGDDGEHGDAAAGDIADPVWRVALGDRLRDHGAFRGLIAQLDGGVVALDDVVGSLGRLRGEYLRNPRFGQLAVLSMIGLISAARRWRPELPEVRQEREAAGKPRPPQPFLDVRLQLWQRELRRMVATVEARPKLRFSDDLDREQRKVHLPLVHCRDCGAMGWATRVDRDKPHLLRVNLTVFYRAFFGNDPQVRFLWPAAAKPDDPAWKLQPDWRVDSARLVVLAQDEDPEGQAIPLVPSHNTRSYDDRKKLHRDCPFCGARESLALVGFRAATLTATFVDQLFASRFNDDRKLLTFSDSVQDAAHRAGFFGARTWRTNLRIALQQFVEESGEGLTLAELPAKLCRFWQGRMDMPTWVSTFLAPSMDWLQGWETVRRTGEVAEGSDLVRMVKGRVAWEVASEYGHRSAIGRALPRAGGSVVQVDTDRLDAAVDAILVPLREEAPGLREVSRETVRRFVLGLVHRLRARGGIDHAEVPKRYLESGGKDRFVFKQRKYLPQYGPKARMPAFLVDRKGTARFDSWVGRTERQYGWYARWVERALTGDDATLVPDAASVYPLVLPLLTGTGLLRQREGAQDENIWGVADSALRVTTKLVRVVCPRCRMRHHAGAAETDVWTGMPCLTARCDGRLEVEGPARRDYFGTLVAGGDLNRIFTAEHTGLLTREERERVEREFKAVDGAVVDPRQPWYPNLLSCTPTLEMGIDIGELSSAILCSVPPAQANYLQRIGRAGRRDGNSLLLTVANARPHDLYFYAEPEEMMDGEVSPPGVFLDAAAVLERQLAAFCLDRWVAKAGDEADVPDKLRHAFDGLLGGQDERFPRNLLGFVEQYKPALLREFFEMFGGAISAAARDHLRRYLLGGDDGDNGETGLAWRITEVLHTELKQRDSLRTKASALTKKIKELRDSKAPPMDLDERVKEHEAEKEALLALVARINRRHTLEFLTDEGLLPNYAFPESAVRLTSVIWRRKVDTASASDKKYDTWTFEYTRAPSSALSELAPGSTFYAGARRVRIDQVDVTVAEVQSWRFCSDCNHAEPVVAGDDKTACPACGSATWPDPGQLHRLLQLRQVFAGAPDRESRIRDDAEEREPRFFQRQMLVDIRGEQSQAWSLDSPRLPFGFEYLPSATFREVNFGELANQGETSRIAGREQIRPGFKVCARCGKVQPRVTAKTKAKAKGNGEEPEPIHALTCPSKKKGAKQEFEDCLYLYRQFDSEAVRMLLPMADLGAARQLNSFIAALQLGLKARFGGKVDHLRTTVYSDPVADSALRKQYLVLFDTVPGGTGYVKQLITPGEPGGELPIFDVLRQALQHIEACSCFNDGGQDGCYRCLLAYRNSRDMDDVSARVASELLRKILAEKDNLQVIDSLGDVSINGLLDSVLEARFLEALRQSRRGGVSAKLKHSVVNHKPGYLFELGDRAWTVEPQVVLDKADGVGMTVSIDFVLRPAWANSKRDPVAVFLDGFEYHRDRVGKDMLQRLLLLQSGMWDVWSLTWYDLDEVLLEGSTLKPINLVHPQLDQLRQRLQQMKLGAYKDIAERPIFNVLVDDLVASQVCDWSVLGASILGTRMATATAEGKAAWAKAVAELAPASIRPALAGIEPQLVAIDDRGLSPWFGLFAAYDGQTMPVLAILDDDPDHWDDTAFRAAWNGTLRLLQLLRGVGNLWFVTRHGRDDLDYGPLLAMRSVQPGEGAASWAASDEIEDEYRELCQALAGLGVEEPQIGVEIDNTAGVVWAEGELVWEARKVVVLDNETRAEAVGKPAAGWRIFVLEELDDPATLVAALAGEGGV